MMLIQLLWMVTCLAQQPEQPALEFDDVSYLYPVERAEINGIPTAWIDQGEGPALLFLHGNGSDLSVFDGVYSELVGQWRVIGVDLPGYGKSAKPRLDYGAEWYANHVSSLLDRLGVRRVVVVAHSYGGLVALSLALKEPGRIVGMALAASPGAWRYPPVQESFMRQAFTPENTLKATPEQIRFSLRFALGEWRDEYEAWVDKRIAISRSKQYPDYAHASYRALVSTLETRLEDRLAGISAPTLLIWGEKDGVVPLQAGRQLEEALPKARLEVIEGTGHFPMLTHRERYLAALKGFLAEVRP